MPDYHSHGYDALNDEALMVKIKRGWQSTETSCGSGSTIANSVYIRSLLPRLVDDYSIQSVADAGAGDLHWMPLVKWDVAYYPFDIYPRHPDVAKLDITKELLPRVDLILCRHVLNHLSIRMSKDAVENFRLSGSKYLLMTNCNKQRQYWNQFELHIGEPIEMFDETQHWTLELYEL